MGNPANSQGSSTPHNWSRWDLRLGREDRGLESKILLLLALLPVHLKHLPAFPLSCNKVKLQVAFIGTLLVFLNWNLGFVDW